MVIRNWEGKEMEKGWVGGHKSREFLKTIYYIFLEDLQASVLSSTKMIYAWNGANCFDLVITSCMNILNYQCSIMYNYMLNKK